MEKLYRGHYSPCPANVIRDASIGLERIMRSI